MRKKLLLTAMLHGLALVCAAQSWSTINSPVTNDLNDVFFVDDNNGWIVGRQGKIIRTSDGGNTWTEENSGTNKDLNKVFMVNTNVGYAVGDDGVFTAYNGTKWTVKSINFSQDMTGVYFIDENTGWISGDWGRIMKTSNGGNSWTSQVTNAQYSNKFNDLFMFDENDGWAVGSSGRVLKYNGSSWQNVTNPAAGDLKDVYAVSFSSSGKGIMTGKSSTVYEFDGSDWHTQNTALPNNSYHIYDVVMVNDNLGYAATTPGFGGQGMILKYNGNTWSKEYEYTGINSELFYGIAVTPSGNIFAVAAGGLIKAKFSGGDPVGLKEKQPQSGVTIFPNPCNDKFQLNITSASGGKVRVKLYDLQGKMALSHQERLKMGETKIEVDVRKLDSGLYNCMIVSDGIVRSFRMAVQK